MITVDNARRVRLKPRRQTIWRWLFRFQRPLGVPRRLANEIVDNGSFVIEDDHIPLDRDDAHRIYEAIWRNMDRENSLINQRITWSILLTSGFIAAESFALTRIIEPITKPDPLSPHAYVILQWAFAFCVILSLCASGFCFMTSIGVNAAQRQIEYLQRRYFRLKDGDEPLFQGTLKLPRPFGNEDDHLSGNIVANTFPLVMMSVWLFFATIEGYGIYVIANIASESSKVVTHVQGTKRAPDSMLGNSLTNALLPKAR